MKKIKLITAVLPLITILLSMLSSCGLFGSQSSDNGLIISEVCASNQTLVKDDYGNYSDWIELYNGTGHDIDLEGYSLSDDESNPRRFIFGKVTIRDGQHLLIWASGLNVTSGENLHAAFKVSASGERITLTSPDGQLVSSLDVPEMQSDLTCGPGENGNVVIFSQATPGAPNSADVYSPPTSNDPNTDNADNITLRINEYATDECITLADCEGDFSAWVELYNYGSQAVKLGGLYLSDDSADTRKWSFPDVTLEAGEYLVVFLGGKGLPYKDGEELHAGFKLTGKEDSLGLYSVNGGIIDIIDVYELFSNVTYGRQLTDGKTCAYFALATPGKPNDAPAFPSIDSALKPSNKSLCVTEVVAVCLDDSRDYSQDFVEIYNPTSNTLLLSEYMIGKKAEIFRAVRLPDVALKPGEYRVIYFGDETDYSAAEDEITVALGLNRYSNNIYIYNNEGICIDSLTTGRLFDGVSAGRATPDSVDLVYFTEVTPGAPNSTNSIGGAIRAPSFSIPGGKVSSGTTIEITADKDDKIYYTLDGSVPDSGSLPYTGPITINTTVTVRAIAYRSGRLPSDAVSASFLVGANHNMPVVFLTADDDVLFSQEKGILATGYNYDYSHYTVARYGSMDAAFTALVADAVDNANFFNDTEAPIHFDYINTDGRQVLSFDAGAKPFGQYSRVRDQKSLTINLRDKYGMQEICYPFFGDNYVNVFSSLVLRNSGQDCYRAHIRDAFIAEAIRGEMDVEVMAYRPVVVYINNEYYGIYDLRERINEDFIANHTGADPDNVDLMKGTSIVLEGDSKAYKELYNFVRDNDMRSDENYAKACEMMDMENYIDYWITQMYFANTDPGNIKFYRERTDDALWRWIPYDFDWSCESTGNFFPRVFEGDRQIYTIIKNLIKNSDFKEMFMARFAWSLETTLDTERLLIIYDNLTSAISSEMPSHIERWSYRWDDDNPVLHNLACSPTSLNAWKRHVSRVRDYIEGRKDFIKKQFMDYFDISENEYADYVELFNSVYMERFLK